ncbi:hypothetical protein VL20_59 [Microcystis panniformis FACHB-1757]|uniref:Uncharacterized protein n=1 Tax=Microcystis panniformis FACHB-1757 TaxID=1638788 RepID=A0A0K1RTS8_9CHRO|nr:hypothetical protein VL20_59 [Microcystis panniformis FACHB-1757]
MEKIYIPLILKAIETWKEKGERLYLYFARLQLAFFTQGQ